VQLKPISWSSAEGGEGGEVALPRCRELLLILKYGGVLTHAGRKQTEELGKVFRTVMYPRWALALAVVADGGGQVRAAPGTCSPAVGADWQGRSRDEGPWWWRPWRRHLRRAAPSPALRPGRYGHHGGGLLRLHSTYRHDFKIYSSDEGRVQTSAAAFTKGLLDLEGNSLTPILVSLVNKNASMLDAFGKGGHWGGSARCCARRPAMRAAATLPRWPRCATAAGSWPPLSCQRCCIGRQPPRNRTHTPNQTTPHQTHPTPAPSRCARPGASDDIRHAKNTLYTRMTWDHERGVSMSVPLQQLATPAYVAASPPLSPKLQGEPRAGRALGGAPPSCRREAAALPVWLRAWAKWAAQGHPPHSPPAAAAALWPCRGLGLGRGHAQLGLLCPLLGAQPAHIAGRRRPAAGAGRARPRASSGGGGGGGRHASP
jgi:hypothetical protein